MAEIMGKQAGVCGGIGGSQHVCAPGFMSNGVQGGIVPTAAGIALAMKLAATDRVSVVFIGDGTLGEGAVYETLNIAALWDLPLLIVLEDNEWAQSTPTELNTAGSMRARFEAFGIPVARDPDHRRRSSWMRGRVTKSGSSARRARPRVLMMHTYRLCHHSKSDDHRPEEEVALRWVTEPLDRPPAASRAQRAADRRRGGSGAGRDRGDGEGPAMIFSGAGRRPARMPGDRRASCSSARTSSIPTAGRSR